MQHAGRVLGKLLALEQFHADHNGHQRVVQVVRDAADQDAEAFKPLSAEKLFLELFVLGNIGVDDEQ